MAGEVKKNPTGLIQSIKNMIERRRAVRVERPDVKVMMKIGGMEVKGISLEDLSTRGMGVMLDFMPGESQAVVVFESPDILKGLEVAAEVRTVRRIESSQEKRYFAGYEFSFSSEAETERLYRWLSTKMDERRPAPSASRETLSRVASSRGNRPEPSVVSALWELKQCAELLIPAVSHFAFPETQFFIAVTGSRVIGALPIIGDTDEHRLPLDAKYGIVLDSLRAAPNTCLAEVWPPSFCGRWIESLSPRTAPLKRTDTLFSIFSLAVVFAKDFARYTDLVVSPPPHLEEFFRMWMFERVPGAEGLMRLRLANFEMRAENDRPELIAHLQKIRRRVELNTALRSGFQADPDFLKAWLSTVPGQ